MSDYEKERDEAAEAYGANHRHLKTSQHFRDGADWATERANIRERRYMDIDDQNRLLTLQLREARAKLAEAERVIKFYAEGRHFDEWINDTKAGKYGWEDPDIIEILDRGEMARDYLAKIEAWKGGAG
jgi:hypothetical protein